MIDIYDIGAGWACLQIGDCVFSVSYLSNLKKELDYLLNFQSEDIDLTTHKVVLEGEGHGDLSLVAHLTFEDVNQYLPNSKAREDDKKYDYVLNILWQNIFSGNRNFALIKYPYNEFMQEYNSLVSSIKDVYIRDFICPNTNDEYEEALKEY